MDEESNDNGSDYVVSEEEALMIGVAIERSRRTARHEVQQRSDAGPSTSRTQSIKHTVESNEELYEDSAEFDDQSDLSVLESSDDEPLSKKKAKAKAKPKKENAKISTELMSWAERAQRRRLARRERNETKREERLLSEKLGRSLTWVCPRSTYQMVVCPTYIPVGEGLPGIAKTPSRTQGCVG